MHLKQLKLAGFKSFVEPTTIPFPSQLVAIVGPNGCGKSNIIDAVRWVMGESSAKNLRGDSMTDVIFNGSTNRKALGQASVELVFDNHLGRMGGPYANYQEISVKRVVTREGESTYYLNNSRCRRRDITDLFLGTGAGTRGYSIIGQNMISQLIEARPEELRTYLEEAAGVSKYKERRRETLLRIEHTRENLARVMDIREELGKQLNRLATQAEAAQIYQALKKEEESLKSQILGLKARHLNKAAANVKKILMQLQLKEDERQQIGSQLLLDFEKISDTLLSIQNHLQTTQTTYFQVNTAIVRLEEIVKQRARDQERLQGEVQQIEGNLLQERTKLDQEAQAHQETTIRIAALQAETNIHAQAFQAQQQKLTQQQLQKMEWESQWHELQTAFQEAKHQADLMAFKQQHLLEAYQQKMVQVERLQQEQANLAVDLGEEKKVQVLALQHDQLQQQREALIQQLTELLAQENSLREQILSSEKASKLLADEIHRDSTELAILQAQQNNQLRCSTALEGEWLKWEKQSRLAEQLKFPEAWWPACELVFADYLAAILVPSLEKAVWPILSQLKTNEGVFVQATAEPFTAGPFPRLLDYCEASASYLSFLKNVFAATDLTQALEWLPQLTAMESIVTQDGYWLAANWIKIKPTNQSQESVFKRQQLITSLQDKLRTEQQRYEGLQGERDACYIQLEISQDQKKQLEKQLKTVENESEIIAKQLEKSKFLLEQCLQKNAVLIDDLLIAQEALEELILQKELAEQNLQKASLTKQEKEAQFVAFNQAKNTIDTALQEAQQILENARAAWHDHEKLFQVESLRGQQLAGNIERITQYIQQLESQVVQYQAQLQDLATPHESLQSQLQEQLAQHDQLAQLLNDLKEQERSAQLEAQTIEQLRKKEEANLKKIQEEKHQQQAAQTVLTTRLADIEVQAVQDGLHLQHLLLELPDDLTLDDQEARLLAIHDKIRHLGAVNLLAIEEYQTELARKEHLDNQSQDLSAALLTLEQAILKMDKETELRLKDTFLQINEAFQALFPRLFGGGRAQLELTCDNLLEAGILVMAQPPGKRNSTIHLLSGGEKAMTAVALVFAIFQLNPSPFCLLDEVDAPLDDSNVQRFCELVKEMSNYVQFLFITHNKMTMELADHLIGVTMKEPGVSRVVAVDIADALTVITKDEVKLSEVGA